MRIAIVGLGLMGASVARAVQRAGRHTIIGVDTSANARDAAHRAEIVHQTFASLRDFDGVVDVVLLATPLSVTLDIIAESAARLRRCPLVMDVGNVKGPIDAVMRDHELERVFVGAHPMCGSEQSGPDAARGDLFDGAPVWLVADDAGPIAEAEQFWRMLGAAAVRRTESATHDALVGAATHLPQLVSSLLAGTLADLGIARERLGPRGRDMTRLAGSDTMLWLDTLTQNRDNVLGALAEFEARLARARAAMETGDGASLHSILLDGRTWQHSR